MKNSKNNNTILGFSFMYLVSVHPMNRTKHSKNLRKLYNCARPKKKVIEDI